MSHRKKTLLHYPLFISIIAVLLLFPVWEYAQENQKDQQKKIAKTQKITEEIEVVAEAPKDRPVSTVTKLDKTQIENIKPLDLSEIIRYAPGATVTFGDKSTYTLKLRGMDAKRIALLIDGIPTYEPYYSSFDLKNIATEGIDSLQLTKGPSSVLYGPNTMGGIVNVITQRPADKPILSLNTSIGENSTYNLGIQTGFRWKRLSFAGNMLYQKSNGFDYPAKRAAIVWPGLIPNMNAPISMPNCITIRMTIPRYYSKAEYIYPIIPCPRAWEPANRATGVLKTGTATILMSEALPH